MTHSINIEGIKLYGFHGCLEEEAKIGGNYIVDVYLTTDFSKAAKTDDLNETLDYCTVYEISKAEMAIRSKLIEQVCERIYTKIKGAFPTLKTLHVRVTKLVPPMNGNVEKVSVEIKD
ncbi:dihydroneopterin aldolase [Aurantibacillus circumpalustris]|uniref:dihydroneopterin aldolase n=1 Tax=Aurantibacillus circumpalustris TaxID=3036359 RepID=UPI00295BF6E1|nr:dihydroneopterin aldolase [Aurantibacillus circumpalustris]